GGSGVGSRIWAGPGGRGTRTSRSRPPRGDRPASDRRIVQQNPVVGDRGGDIAMDDLTKLLADAAWLRPLAFRLAGPDDADDALQQAWLAQRTRAHGVRDARSWLGTVFANVARRRRRGDARRRRQKRGHGAAGTRRARAPDEPGAGMELRRRGAGAVLALAEPYRSTVLAHCLDGRTTKEIAEATGEPWATVRSRLARGIEQLRAA